MRNTTRSIMVAITALRWLRPGGLLVVLLRRRWWANRTRDETLAKNVGRIHLGPVLSEPPWATNVVCFLLLSSRPFGCRDAASLGGCRRMIESRDRYCCAVRYGVAQQGHTADCFSRAVSSPSNRVAGRADSDRVTNGADVSGHNKVDKMCVQHEQNMSNPERRRR